MSDARPVEEREFELAPTPSRLGLPLVSGVALGLTVLGIFDRAGLPSTLGLVVGLAAALATGTLVHALAQRSAPDRIRVTGEAVELAHGAKTVRRVRLAKLSQVNELRTQAGSVLLIADDARALALAQGQLVVPRAYETLTQLIVERMQALDPTGELSRRAVEAGRQSDVIIQRPVRLAPFLAGPIALASLVSLTVLYKAVETRPYPEVALGALSAPLVHGGETWRLFSYVFLHANPIQLALAIFGIFWFVPFVERLVGWERTLVAFVAGVAGAAAGQLAFWPLPQEATGACGGVVGLIGLIAAVSTVGRRRLPRALLPNTPVWAAVALFFVPVVLLGGMSVIAYPCGALAGSLVGLATLAGQELPPDDESRREIRPFAWLAVAALAVGFVGGVVHLREHHPDDDELVTRAYLQLQPNVLTAELQNQLAYVMLLRPELSNPAKDTAAELAEAAARATDRKRPEILDTLAVARYRQGNSAEAKQLLQQALQLETDASTRQLIQHHLEEVTNGKPVSDSPN